MNQVLLFGPTACHNKARLQRLLKSDWRMAPIPDESDLARLSQALPRSEAILSLFWNRRMAEHAKRLKLIQALGAGVDAYDLTTIPPGCALCNVYEHEVPMAEYVIGAMVAMSARFIFHDRQLRQGSWDGTGRRDGAPHEELAGKTIGLIGFGRIGHEVAKRARAFGLNVHAVRSRPEAVANGIDVDWLGGPAQLQELMRVSDYLVVCCPLNEQTRGLLDRQYLSRMKPTAYLINVARAEVIEEQALFAALKERRIAGAALDVWYRYPENGDQRLLPATLPFHELDNVLMTPHLSAWTEAMIERRWAKIAANLDALAEGRPLDNVVPTRPENV
jgi:phosphoglycerate dehydrogenase-like enzyme